MFRALLALAPVVCTACILSVPDQDGGIRYIDGGIQVTVIDGGVRHIDGGVWTIDGGTHFIDDGVQTVVIAVFPAGSFVLIPQGLFSMGSIASEAGHQLDESPPHTVEITRPFYLQRTEVTQADWLEAMGTNPSNFVPCGPSCPVEFVSWYDAISYANTLSRQEDLPECYTLTGTTAIFAGVGCLGYRLPTEAEWEYAARAGTTSAFSTGPIIEPSCEPVDPNLDAIGWYCGNSEVTYAGCFDGSPIGGQACIGPRPVGLKPPNRWGLYDMHGNVREWVHDIYDPGYYNSSPMQNPIGSLEGVSRVCRGGSWGDFARDMRAASRQGSPPDIGNANLGFRLARGL